MLMAMALAVGVFTIMFVLLSLGTVLGNRRLKGSCGGLGSQMAGGKAEACGVCGSGACSKDEGPSNSDVSEGLDRPGLADSLKALR